MLAHCRCLAQAECDQYSAWHAQPACLGADGPEAERVSMLCACSVEGMLCARLYTKGAAELLLQQCASRLADGTRVERLSQEEKSALLESFAVDGNRSAALPSAACILHSLCDSLPPWMTWGGALHEMGWASMSGRSPGAAARRATCDSRAGRWRWPSRM